jgi:hypothetical protein
MCTCRTDLCVQFLQFCLRTIIVLMTKFGKSERTRLSDLLFRNIRFQQFHGFEAWKRTKKYQRTKMEEIQARRRGRKNWTVRFWIPEYPVFPEQIESD